MMKYAIKKDRLETSGLFALRVCGRAFGFILVETRGGRRVSKGCFEPAGSTRFHLDGLKGRVP